MRKDYDLTARIVELAAFAPAQALLRLAQAMRGHRGGMGPPEQHSWS